MRCCPESNFNTKITRDREFYPMLLRCLNHSSISGGHSVYGWGQNTRDTHFPTFSEIRAFFS